MTMKKALFFACLIGGVLKLAAAAAPEPPLVWVTPPGFDPQKPGLGMEQLPGITTVSIYDPLISNADPSMGGHRAYESVLHGTYNHHQQFVLIGDEILVFWTNHVRDENGPGQRILARTGRFDGKGGIIWAPAEKIVEVAPPGHPPRFRSEVDDQDTVDGAFMDGTLFLADGRLFLRGRLLLCDGWTDRPEYHFPPKTEPIPDENYSPGKTKTHRMDCYWYFTTFVQEWKLADGQLLPVSPLYLLNPLPTELRLTPTIVKKVAPFNEPYRSAKLLSEAPEDFQRALAAPPTYFQRFPKYASAADARVAADGKNGLAHYAEFHRPDGCWVAIRDNLLETRTIDRTYYAAVKKADEPYFPPAELTNLFGTAMPVAGELPDGKCWVIGSDISRCNAYITWSDDGKLFDRSRLLLSLQEKVTPGLCKPAVGGAQYFQSFSRDGAIYILYSVGKEDVRMTRIPMEALK